MQRPFSVRARTRADDSLVVSVRLSSNAWVAATLVVIFVAVLAISFSPLNPPLFPGVPSSDFWSRTNNDPVSFWTFWLMLFTGVLSTVSIVQLIYITRADATSRIAANAAMISATVARDTLHLTQRAYIAFGENLRFTNHGALNVEFDFTLENHGQTPARELRAEFRCEYLAALPSVVDYTNAAVLGTPSMSKVYHGHVRFEPGIPVPYQALISQRLLFPFIWGRVSFTDIFGQPHARGFAARVDITGGQPVFSLIELPAYDYEW